MSKYILAIDQGTTSSRAMLFDSQGHAISKAQCKFQQYFPKPGWVELDPEEIWQSVLKVCQEVMTNAKCTAIDIAAIGITNQRETTVIWDRVTGKPIHRAIVWQDRRTADICQQIKKQDDAIEITVREKTGLLLDPYFCATKIKWILDHVPNARQKAQDGGLAFGTIDTFLLWRLTGGKSHTTDITNASRTSLYNIVEMKWDDELLAMFEVPKAILPEVKDNCADFGMTAIDLFDEAIPIAGMAGDQQAASIGQGCFLPGMVKSTYGTGCFVLVNTGKELVFSENRLLSTILYRIHGEICYAIEGSIFNAGTAVDWLSDQLKIIKHIEDAEKLAKSIESTQGVYFVPAFTGLGAPYWQPDSRAMLSGLTRDSGTAEIARAALEAVAYQTKDLLEAIKKDGVPEFKSIRVDGGMVANDWLLQFLANMLNIRIEKPVCIETTTLGAAYLAGLQVGFYESLDKIKSMWENQAEFLPRMDKAQRDSLYQGWLDAVKKV